MAVANYLVTDNNLGAVKFTNTEIAHTHPVYGLLIGWAFAIWGIIYTLEGLFVVYQALPFQRFGGLREPSYAKIRGPVLALFAANSAWLFLFGYEVYWASQVVILVYDALLFVVLRRLDVNQLSSRRSAASKLAAAAFSANASWVTVASCLGIQVVLLDEGWLPSPDFAIGLLVVAVAVACAATFEYSDPVYAAVAAWALGGIIANQADASEFGCKSQICPACLAAAIPICSRDDTSARDGRPNGFAPLDCDSYTESSPDECVVAKSASVVGWAYAGIGCVAFALAAGLVRGYLRRQAEKRAPRPQPPFLEDVPSTPASGDSP